MCCEKNYWFININEMLCFRFIISSKTLQILPDTLWLQLRGLSSAEVTTALRPFYFLVHPDLFGQHPRAQHINDASLKLLNNHLDLLINDQRPGPVSLQFYVRNKNIQGLSIASFAWPEWMDIWQENREECTQCIYWHLSEGVSVLLGI